jgi:plastocyanin
MLLGSAVPAVAGTISVQANLANHEPFAGAVVTVRAQGAHAPSAPISAILDQINLTFVPDIIVIPVGSTVEFPNSDSVSHQIYSFSPTKRFQLPLYHGKPYPPVHFDQAGYRHPRLQYPRPHGGLHRRDGRCVLRAHGCAWHLVRDERAARHLSRECVASAAARSRGLPGAGRIDHGR